MCPYSNDVLASLLERRYIINEVSEWLVVNTIFTSYGLYLLKTVEAAATHRFHPAD